MSRTHTMPNPSTSEVEIFEEDLEKNIAYLKANIQWVEDDYQDFAKSLCAAYEKYDTLSPKQMWRACQFWQMVNQNKPEDEPSRGKVVKLAEVKREKNLQPVIKANATDMLVMFARAAEKLKKIVLKFKVEPPLQDINHLTFMRRTYGIGDVGNIMVIGNTTRPINRENKTSVALAEGMLRDGTVMFHIFTLHRPEVQKKIAEIFANPIASFATNGKTYGNCCFCGLELSNPVSVKHGYGPICAANYGLPWSEEDAEPTLHDI